jgi:ankyrin repeat protein
MIRSFAARRPIWNARNAKVRSRVLCTRIQCAGLKGETVLHCAVRNVAVPSLVHVLLEEVDAIEIDAVTKMGATALHYAVLCANDEALDALVAHEANAEMKLIASSDQHKCACVCTVLALTRTRTQC